MTVQHAWPVGSTKSKGVETILCVRAEQWSLCHRLVGKSHRHSRWRFGGHRSERRQARKRRLRTFQTTLIVASKFWPWTFCSPATIRSEIGRAPEYTQLLATVGDRPIGIKAAQLLAITSWMERTMGARAKHILSTGIRSQAVSLVAAALNPAAYAEVSIREGMRSFGWLLDKPVPYEVAPDLFCLDLYKEFDLPRLAALAAPAEIRQSYVRQIGSVTPGQ